MGRNEVKLRRKAMSPVNLRRHRNYSDLMTRHERYRRFKRIMDITIYFLVALIIIIGAMMMRTFIQQQKIKKSEKNAVSAMMITPAAKSTLSSK